MADRETELIARLAPGVSRIDAAAWDRLASGDPFLSHAFLAALAVGTPGGPAEFLLSGAIGEAATVSGQAGRSDVLRRFVTSEPFAGIPPAPATRLEPMVAPSFIRFWSVSALRLTAPEALLFVQVRPPLAPFLWPIRAFGILRPWSGARR